MKKHDEPLALAPDQVGAPCSSLHATGRGRICRVNLPAQHERLDHVLDAVGQHQLVKGLLVPVDGRDVADVEMD